MTECATLCSRVGIIYGGRLVTIGTPQELRNRFGKGYTLIIKTTAGGDYSELTKYIKNTYPGSELKEEGVSQLRYFIQAKSMRGTELFTMLQEMKDSQQVKDYYISQMALEDIFTDFCQKERI